MPFLIGNISLMRLLTLIRFPAFTESPATECERVRAEMIMRNNRVFQSLGINATKDILNKTIQTKKDALLNKTTAAKKAMARENSGSLYDPRDSDGSEEGVVDKVFVELRFFV